MSHIFPFGVTDEIIADLEQKIVDLEALPPTPENVAELAALEALKAGLA